jgi:hypothetical protein
MNWPLMAISLFKVGLLAFTATVSQWETDPLGVALFGLFIVTTMPVTRVAGWGYVQYEKEIMDTVTFISRHGIIPVGRG